MQCTFITLSPQFIDFQLLRKIGVVFYDCDRIQIEATSENRLQDQKSARGYTGHNNFSHSDGDASDEEDDDIYRCMGKVGDLRSKIWAI